MSVSRPTRTRTRFAKRSMALVCSWALLAGSLYAPTARAGLDSEMHNMFNSMGMLSNISSPGAFRGQAMNTYTGGEMQVRAPIRNYQLWSVSLPSIKAGCGGIDVFGGSFSIINVHQFKAMLQQVGNNTVGLLFQSAIASINPMLASKLEWLQQQVKDYTNFSRNSCQMAQSLVGSMSEATGVNATSSCQFMAKALYNEDDAAATVRCASAAPTVNADAKNSPNADIKSMAKRNVNLIWEALSNTSLTKEEKEMFMNIAGTVVMYNALDNDGVAKQPVFYEPTVDSLKVLMQGNDGGASAGKVRISNWLTCPDDACLQPLRNTSIDITPFTEYARQTMESLRDKMFATNLVPTSGEVGFVNMTRIPVYKMLAVGYMGSRAGDQSVVNSLIGQYAPVVAFDYAQVFLQRSLKDARVYLRMAKTQNSLEDDKIKVMVDNVNVILQQIDGEMALISLKIPASETVVNALQRTERDLRASLPAGVKNMIDFSSVLSASR